MKQERGKTSLVVREAGMEDRPLSKKQLKRLAPELFRDRRIRGRFSDPDKRSRDHESFFDRIRRIR